MINHINRSLRPVASMTLALSFMGLGAHVTQAASTYTLATPVSAIQADNSATVTYTWNLDPGGDVPGAPATLTRVMNISAISGPGTTYAWSSIQPGVILADLAPNLPLSAAHFDQTFDISIDAAPTIAGAVLTAGGVGPGAIFNPVIGVTDFNTGNQTDSMSIQVGGVNVGFLELGLSAENHTVTMVPADGLGVHADGVAIYDQSPNGSPRPVTQFRLIGFVNAPEYTMTFEAVPEPSSALLALLGSIPFFFARRK